ncbi:MAG TPA: hypothetical protein VG247_07800 [Pseudonocardiaceae bacterium]|jgi:hypothetical protein|nr:hypothetical protein [Pseudonocardiaceae bacterium]
MRKKIVIALGIAAACTLTGTAAAAPSAPAHPGGTVHIIDYIDNDNAITTAVVTGAVGDLGEGVSINSDGTLSTEHTELNMVLSQGTFRLNTAELDKNFIAAAGSTPFQHGPKSCSGFMTASAPVPIVAGSGTGAYRGISGTFQLTMTAGEVDVPTTNNRCDITGALLGQVIVTEGAATVSFAP